MRARADRLDAELAAERSSSVDLARQVEMLRIGREAQLDFIHGRAQRFGRRMGAVATWMVVAISLAGVIAVWMGDSVPVVFRAAASAVGLVVTVVGAISQTTGGSVQDFVRRVEPLLARWREAQLLSTAGFGPADRRAGQEPSESGPASEESARVNVDLDVRPPALGK